MKKKQWWETRLLRLITQQGQTKLECFLKYFALWTKKVKNSPQKVFRWAFRCPQHTRSGRNTQQLCPFSVNSKKKIYSPHLLLSHLDLLHVTLHTVILHIFHYNWIFYSGPKGRVKIEAGWSSCSNYAQSFSNIIFFKQNWFETNMVANPTWGNSWNNGLT